MLLLIRLLLILEPPAIKVQPGNIANNLSQDSKEDEQGEHHKRRLTKGKCEHGKKNPNRGDKISNLSASQDDQLLSFILEFFDLWVFLARFYGLDDGGDNVGENRTDDRYDDGKSNNDSPKAKYICRSEILALDHLNHPD